MKTTISGILIFLCIFVFSEKILFAQILDSPRDGVFDKIHTLEKKPIQYSPLREADVVWSERVWRVVDMRQKINEVFYFPTTPHNTWKSFMTVIMEGLQTGQLTGYDITPTDEFTTPLTYEELQKVLPSDTITQTLQRPYPPYDEYDTTYFKPFIYSDVKKFRIKEDWFFDKQRSIMDVRILGICPVYDKLDENGNFFAETPLFWIYFPEARPVFAQAEVFNRNNGAERRTFDEIFWKRMFGSYIYKEENVYDRRILSYVQGMDALLEAERIKQDLFEIEHELWEF